MSANLVNMPETRDVVFRASQENEEKIVFFSEAAVDRAVTECRIPEAEAASLKEVLRRPGEVAAVLEWNGMANWEKSQLQKKPFSGGGGYYDTHGNLHGDSNGSSRQGH